MGFGAILGISFVGLVALIILIGFFLPKKAHVARAVVIDASSETIFNHLNDLQLFIKWSPWTEKDPNMSYLFEGNNSGEGQIYKWEGNPKTVGSGKMTITQSVPNEKIVTEIDFGKMGTVEAKWVIETKEDKCKVIWTLDTNLGINPIARYFGLFMDKRIGTDYEHGLNKLKAQLSK